MITSAIEDLLPVQRPEGLYQAGRHLVDAGGKRLRPSLLLMAAEAVGADPRPLVPAAVSVELIHNFTLIHDDIMDNANLRRGKSAVHVLWGVSGAILAGDTLYSKAFQILCAVKADPSRVLMAMEKLSQTCTKICEGQWLDLEFEERDVPAASVTESEYMEMIEKKTGVLYGASASIGAILAGADERKVHAMEEFGRLTGMGFQIHDDVLDLTAPASVIGKKRGGDLVEGKRTLIMIDAMSKGVIPEAFGKKDATMEQIDAGIAALQDCGCIEYARRRSRDLVEEGKRALDAIEPSPVKELLLLLADYMIHRGH
jgi:geranylgeranyl diphosphate synthase type I